MEKQETSVLTVPLDVAVNGDVSAERQQPSPACSSVAGSSKQQYQPAKCNEERIRLLLQNSGFNILNENGQRRYCQPNVAAQSSNKGCEVFIGKLPPDCFEDELVPLLERSGKLRELRIMMEYSGTNRGYGFATFESRDSAKQAVRDLNNYEIRKGKTLGVCLSVDNCRLFVGGIPKLKLKEEVFAEMRQLTEGVVDVIMYPSASDKTKNRGFAFVEYDSHRSAAVARKKLMNGKAQLWGHPIAVDWAEPERFVDEDVMATVKILYVRNLMLSTTEEKLREVFTAVCDKPDAVERVKKIRDYAFVHFRDRADALKCRDVLNNTQLEGTVIEVCLAKPVDKSERQQMQASANANALHGAGLINSNQVTPLLSSSVPMYFDPTMLAMTGGLALPVPQVLGIPPVSSTLFDPSKLLSMQNAISGGRHSSGSRASRHGQGDSRSTHGTKRRQQFGRSSASKEHQSPSNVQNAQQTVQRKPFEVKISRRVNQSVASDPQPPIAATELNALIANPASLSIHKLHTDVLEELCQQHALGSPVYNLHTTISHAGVDLQMYLFKVTLPLTGITFTPNRLCANVEDARQCAAEFVLQQLAQHSPLLSAPLVGSAEELQRMTTLQNPLLGNVGGLYPLIQLPQFMPTLSPFLLPQAMAHASVQNTQQPNALNVQVGRPLDASQAKQACVAQPPRFDPAAAQYYDANLGAANASYLPQQPMQPGPQANVAY